VPWNTIGCPPLKMGVFGRILTKKERIEGILRRIGEKSKEKSLYGCFGISSGKVRSYS
jgi:hypothetical protein